VIGRLDARGRRLRAALAAVLVRDNAPELRLVHDWLDSWSGIGLIVVGMSHQGFTVSLGEHGVGPHRTIPALERRPAPHGASHLAGHGASHEDPR
jgi:hypothetical protein